MHSWSSTASTSSPRRAIARWLAGPLVRVSIVTLLHSNSPHPTPPHPTQLAGSALRRGEELELAVAIAVADARKLAGYPIATAPLGNLEGNGQPFGLFLLAREKREGVLLRLMALCEEGGVTGCAGPEVEV